MKEYGHLCTKCECIWAPYDCISGVQECNMAPSDCPACRGIFIHTNWTVIYDPFTSWIITVNREVTENG